MNLNITTLVELSKLFIPVIAVAGIYIAWQQFTANREKIRLDLYDKRFNVYDIIIKHLYDSIYGEEDIQYEEYSRFLTACNEARFLVPDKVYFQVRIAEELIKETRIAKRRISRYEKSGNKQNKVQELKKKIFSNEEKIENLHPKITEVFIEVLKFEKF